MFELRLDKDGDRMLFYVDAHHVGRGRWVPVAHTNDEGCMECVAINREMGVQVEVDEHRMYRAWVLYD